MRNIQSWPDPAQVKNRQTKLILKIQNFSAKFD